MSAFYESQSLWVPCYRIGSGWGTHFRWDLAEDTQRDCVRVFREATANTFGTRPPPVPLRAELRRIARDYHIHYTFAHVTAKANFFWPTEPLPVSSGPCS